jgi:hypothetical protein
MDNFDLAPKPKINARALIFNILTVLTLISACCMSYYFLQVFINPYSPLNIFPPAQLPTAYASPTETITPIQIQSTWTPTETIRPTASRTRAATWTLLPEMITPTITDTPTATGSPTETGTATTTSMPAVAEITYDASTAVHANSGCAWFGIGGKVLDASGKTLPFQTIQLGGTLDGQVISRLTLSGSNLAYGDSGYEFALGDHPIASTKTLWIQLFDNTGKPLTDKIYFDTFSDCNKNLVLIIFKRSR